jgi:hypothetical protein
MVKIDTNFNQTQTDQSANQQSSTNQSQSTETKKPSGLITTLGSLLPFAPLVFEQFTGQKVPQLSGTMADIQLALTNLQTNLAVISQIQQQIMQRITTLETNANQHLTNLTQQFQSFRLTHTREKKQIDFNQPQLENSQDY